MAGSEGAAAVAEICGLSHPPPPSRHADTGEPMRRPGVPGRGKVVTRGDQDEQRRWLFVCRVLMVASARLRLRSSLSAAGSYGHRRGWRRESSCQPGRLNI